MAGPFHSYTEVMPETRDKRRRNDLDLFVLALVNEGISIPCALRKAASLSPGAAIPALKRLLRAGYLLHDKPGPRGRTEHSMTSDGQRHLKTAWRSLIEGGPSGDPDADLRVALLAIWVGSDRRLGADFLRQSAARIRNSGGREDGQQSAPDLPPIALWYRKLRSASAHALVRSQADALLAMATALPKKASGRGRMRSGPSGKS